MRGVCIMTILDKYLNCILKKQLDEFGILNEAADKVLENIRLQVLSLLQYWDDTTFRNTILSIGMEEALFYEPYAKNEIKCFVVTTIRNSLFETLTSRDHAKLNTEKIVSDEQVKLVTSKAIEYFSSVDFSQLSKELDYSNIKNIYCELKKMYPSAWKVFETIGNTAKKSIRYTKCSANPDLVLLGLFENFEETDRKTINKIILDGYDEKMDKTLLDVLYTAYTEKNFVFFVDCFKMISRNIKKLFRVVEFLLYCNQSLVTVNYYITQGYIEVRHPLIKPAHQNDREIKQKLQNLKGISATHAKVLKDMQKNFNQSEISSRLKRK